MAKLRRKKVRLLVALVCLYFAGTLDGRVVQAFLPDYCPGPHAFISLPAKNHRRRPVSRVPRRRATMGRAGWLQYKIRRTPTNSGFPHQASPDLAFGFLQPTTDDD